MPDLTFLDVDADTARRIRAKDWAGTPFGPPAEWPAELRTLVGLILRSPSAMLLCVGRERRLLYNDAYVAVLGRGRHPAALGEPATRVSAEFWPGADHVLAEAMAGRPLLVENQRWPPDRDGRPRELFHSFSLTPVTVDGEPGLLAVAVDNTAQVVGARRLETLRALSEVAPAEEADAAELCRAAVAVLDTDRFDIAFALVYLLDRDGTARLVASSGIVAGSPVAPLVLPDMPGLVARQVLLTSVDGIAGNPAGTDEGLLPLPAPLHERLPTESMVLPLSGDTGDADRPLGVIMLGASPYAPLDDEYRAFGRLVGSQLSGLLADQRAHLAERRRSAELTEIALTLQRSILGPTELPAGYAARYEPAAGGLEVGGDWFTLTERPDGTIGLVVGDVVGHGLSAAAAMGQLRSGAQALLLEGRSPAQVLTTLDVLAARVPDARCTTVFCLVLDLAAGTARYSSAGHPPAVLARAGGAVLLEGAQSVPLGVVDGVRRPEAEVAVGPGEPLLLYTDGLVERRGETLDTGIERVVRVLTAHRGLRVGALADLILEQLVRPHHDDDVALLLHGG